MLGNLCAELHNYFSDDDSRTYGTFSINGGILSPVNLQPGQYFRIVGSVYNDGVHQYPPEGLTDETFTGSVWAMSVPPDFLALAEKIEKYQDSEAPAGVTSESWSGYSYSKATKNGIPLTALEVFSTELGRWRKIETF